MLCARARVEIWCCSIHCESKKKGVRCVQGDAGLGLTKGLPLVGIPLLALMWFLVSKRGFSHLYSVALPSDGAHGICV